MHPRPLPRELADRLATARRVEDCSVTLQQRRDAIHATAVLLLATTMAGWRPFELVPALAMPRSAVAARVDRARKVHGGRALGITVAAPQVPDRDLPLAERHWLQAREVRAITGVSDECLDQWRREGLLPRTRLKPGGHAWYAREGVDRLLAAPRRGKCGIRRSAVLAMIDAERNAQATARHRRI